MPTPQPETQSASDDARAKHTPGPWLIGRGADGAPLVMVPVHPSEGSGFGVAHINRLPRMGSVSGDMDANARLIAAAPDLLEALRNLKALFDCMGGPESGTVTFRCREVSPLYVAARAALAKAGA